jgi:hypothetical protein
MAPEDAVVTDSWVDDAGTLHLEITDCRTGAVSEDLVPGYLEPLGGEPTPEVPAWMSEPDPEQEFPW